MIGPMPLNWKVPEILQEYDITTYQFWRDSGLAQNTAYAIANNDRSTVDVRVLNKLLPYLRQLTGNNGLNIGDIVEYIP